MAETEGRLSERRAIYPGSFDPPTRGHLDVVERARGLFDVLYVAVLENPAKAPLFTIEERVALLEGELAGRAGVRVVSFGGLTSDLARRLRA
ncbi:MAG: adenylyltransferase/cytidyltransferase family protein, partial [Planctomycetota bacterium]